MQDNIQGAQIRAARMFLDWSRRDLAEHSGVSVETIKNFESGVFNPRNDTLTKLIDVFTKQGLTLSEEGVHRTPLGYVPNPVLDGTK